MYSADAHLGERLMKPIFAVQPQDTAKFTWGNSAGNSTLHQWSAPDKTEVLVGVTVQCPSCRYPIYIKASTQAVEVHSGVLTIRHEVKCPAHWAMTDEYGNFEVTENGSLSRVHCGWAAIIHRGSAHARQCGALRVRGSECTCSVGGDYEQSA